jgi:NADH-quinone oxidoreductase subunit E
MEKLKIDEIIEKHNFEEADLIGILQDLQESHPNKYLPKDSLEYISKILNVPLNRIYHIATFFKAFSLKPKGKNTITVCVGTACHVKGSGRILDKLQNELNIKPGETTKDLMFTLEAVNCLGCCALAPVVVVNNEYYGHITQAKISKILKSLQKG